jgi:hypothetical protein
MSKTQLTTQEKARINFVKHLASLIYPDYKGRKFRIHEQETYHLENYWDGGSRTYSVAIDFKGNRVIMPSPETLNPYNKEAHLDFTIPPGIGILEHVFFCGKDLGICLVLGTGQTQLTDASHQENIRQYFLTSPK